MEFFVTSQGIPVRVSDSGKEGTTLLFLHGYLETLDIWEDFMATVPDSYRTVAIDLPGHGLTGSRPDINDIDFCAQVAAGVLDILSIKKVVPVGHSMGGYVAQSFLALFPERTEGLIHLNSNCFADLPEKASDRNREISLILEGKLLSLASVSIPHMYARQNLRRMDDAVQKTVELCDMHDPTGICATVRGMMRRRDQTEMLRHSGKPLLFVFGDSDPFFPLERRQILSDALPAAETAVLSGTAHNSFVEDPDSTLSIMLSFLQKNGL